MVNLSKNYLLLFLDNLIVSSILPVYKGFMFYSILYFKKYYDTKLILLFGVLGLTIGGIVNWYLGRVTIYIREWYHKVEKRVECKIITASSRIIKSLLIYAVVLLSWIPVFGSVIQVLSGYLKLNLGIFTLLSTMSNFFYLLYLVVTVY